VRLRVQIQPPIGPRRKNGRKSLKGNNPNGEEEKLEEVSKEEKDGFMGHAIRVPMS
jgi:hypothetical protein